MRKRHIVSVLGAGALALALSACNSVDNPIAPGGAASVKVDGRALDLPNASVGCVNRDGRVHISVGSETGNGGVSAVVTAGDQPQVISVGLGAVDGVTLGYISGIPGTAPAAAKKVMKTYTITGEATGINLTNPLQPSRRQFEIKVRCP